VPDLDLELALAACGRELSFPPTPDLVTSVTRRLATTGQARPARRSRRRVLVLAFAIVLATAGIAAAVTAGLHGLGVVFVDKLPPVTPGKGLALGLQVKQGEARRLAGFKLVLPGPPLGQPDAWFVEDVGSDRAVSLVWKHRPSLPPARRQGVSVLATETPGKVDYIFLKKLIGSGTTALPVHVGTDEGLWISGKRHILVYRAGNGAFTQEKLRLVGNVLAWNRGPLLIRIEGARTLEEAQRLAASFHGTG
jgi:hypothetical protein